MKTNLGTLISTIYEAMLAQFGDPVRASVATAAVVNDVLARSKRGGR